MFFRFTVIVPASLNERNRHDSFELQALEPRILLSADAVAAATPWDLNVDIVSQGSVIEESFDQISSSGQTVVAYDPFAQIDDLFAEAPLEAELVITGDDAVENEVQTGGSDAENSSLTEDEEASVGSSDASASEDDSFASETLSLEEQATSAASHPGGEEQEAGGQEGTGYQYDLTESLVVALTAAHGPPEHSDNVEPVNPLVPENSSSAILTQGRPVLTSYSSPDASQSNHRIQTSDQTLRGVPCES